MGVHRGFPALDALALGLQSEKDLDAVLFAAQWHDNLGVEIEWQGLEVGVWFDRMNREPPHIHLSRWLADYPDPDSFLRTNPFRRRTGWRNDAYDRLVEQAQHATVPGERIKLYQQADAILVQEVPLMPVYYERYNVLVKPWVSRFPTSGIRYRGYWKDVIIEPH